MLNVTEAAEQLLASATVINKTEMIDLRSSLGRVVAQDCIAPMNSPLCDNSAMDGYALNSEYFNKHSPEQLEISHTICAGDKPSTLLPGTVARILTGAPVPLGADTVVIQEECQVSGNMVTINDAVTPGMNIRFTGEDISSGEVIIQQGETILPQHMALLASVGIDKITVFRRLNVAIASSGDELLMPGQPAVNGKTYNSNHFAMIGQLEALGCKVIDLGILPDDFDAICNTLLEVSGQADIILTSGGVSVGDKDFIKQVVEKQGELKLWKIAIKPGKPLAFGIIKDTPVFGMPGNPVSQFVTFIRLVQPVIEKMQGKSSVKPTMIWGEADFEYQNKGAREEYLRARYQADNGGKNLISKSKKQGSAHLSSLSWANCLAIIPPESNIKPGQKLMFIPIGKGML